MLEQVNLKIVKIRMVSTKNRRSCELKVHGGKLLIGKSIYIFIELAGANLPLILKNKKTKKLWSENLNTCNYISPFCNEVKFCFHA